VNVPGADGYAKDCPVHAAINISGNLAWALSCRAVDGTILIARFESHHSKAPAVALGLFHFWPSAILASIAKTSERFQKLRALPGILIGLG
jgi:hypothetical protein